MKTTLRKILSFDPCGQYKDATTGWNNAMKWCMKEFGTIDLDTEVSILQILDNSGIRDAVWCLRAIDISKYRLFVADVAESVLHLFEDKYPDDKRPRNAIESLRKFHYGEISEDELNDATDAASAASNAAYYAAYYADAAYDADAAAADAAYAAYHAAYHAAYAAYAAAHADCSTYHAANAAPRDEKWVEIETLLRKHIAEK